MKNYTTLFCLFLLSCTSLSGQQLTANINLNNGGSLPRLLMGNDDYGAFFARPDGGRYQLYFMQSEDDQPTRLASDLPFLGLGIPYDSRLVGDDVHFRLYDNETRTQTYLKADLVDNSLETLAVLSSHGSGSGTGKYESIDATNEVLFINRNEMLTFQLFRTDGTSEGTQFVQNLPDNQFATRIASQGGHAYIIYPADIFNDEPAFLYHYDGTSVNLENLPVPTDRGLAVETFDDKVLLSGFTLEGNTHLLASADLENFTDLSNFPNDVDTDFLNVAFIKDDEVYYTRSGEDYTLELLRTDTLGTSLDHVVDLNADADSITLFDADFDPESGLLFYLGFSFVDNSIRLYRSDLTQEGTFALADMQPAGSQIVNSQEHAFSDGKFYFRAFREATGEELWVSDGTVEGTHPVEDLVPGFDGAQIEQITSLADRVIFHANSINFGEEVFITAGSPETTDLIADINETEAGSIPGRFFNFQDSLLFIANDGCTGPELYMSGGTSASTRLIKDLLPGREGYSLSSPIEVADKAYYHDLQIIVETDGTADGTKGIFPPPGQEFTSMSAPGQMGDDLLISAYSSQGVAGQRLFRFDPTTLEMDALLYISEFGANGTGQYFVPLNESITLFKTFTEEGQTLFRTDGTAEGSYKIPIPGIEDLFAITLRQPVGGIAYLTVIEQSGARKIFRTDGTITGTYQLDFQNFNNTILAFEYQGQPHFFANNFNDSEFYQIDPSNETITATGLLNDAAIYSGQETLIGDTIYFAAETDEAGTELWMIAGPEESAVLVADLRSGPLSSAPRHLRRIGNMLYFTATGDDGQRHLYQSDGTTSGTFPVREITGSTTGFSPSNLFVYNDIIYFPAIDSTLGRELFRYDPAAPTDTTGLGDMTLADQHCPVPDTSVNVTDLEMEVNLTLFPNPAQDFIQITHDDDQFTSSGQWEVVDANGRRAMTGNVNGVTDRIDLRALPSGNYLLRYIYTNGMRTQTRFTKI